MPARSSAKTGVERLPTVISFAPAHPRVASRRRSIVPYALWCVQIALALLFLFAGGMKFAMSSAELTKDTALSATFLRFIGACEVLGAIGLVAPALARRWRFLTPVAAAGLVVIMIGATVVTTIELSAGAAIFPLAIGVLAANVAYARRLWLSGAVR